MNTTTENSFPSAGSTGTHGSGAGMGAAMGAHAAAAIGADVEKEASAAERSAEAQAAADASAIERAARRAEGQDILSRVVKGAHEAIDRLADTAAPHVYRLEDTVDSANVSMRSRADQAREVGDEWADSLRSTVRDNPLAAVAAAVALGVLIARLTR
ncbi:MAG: hypothetical protein M3Y32_05325 [Pseudomonadota bacterium]|nr:hypothetical protein [Pseudomonadota bacterium]